ncbi:MULTISPECIES: cytochrome c oxidase assembly protein [Brevibacillus]|nr:cytochrome c oxidase assembly protein [Brevibacillus borstelensis]KKX57212.1 cytochrome AA3 biosynthesis protein [Brevibacillus borstelensis cifa_chp40]MBE5395777.1 cytochrome c oxidase assembly protein [Brevibacillus borstelensis]MCC0563943.1 cytochrome c oxidase assembly protein [Brevibacillus borstelensis]MCM3469942.1 cytochrome c oxidase assembly protein [Brevibacillus borstelensis]MCM3558407.1 cytochrome c oxidase assembly protein [Brevibacillus borstelensis]
MHDHHQHGTPVDGGIGSFSDMWSPTVILITILLTILYFALTGPLRHRFADSKPATAKQKVLFVLAMLFFYAGAGSPINYVGHHYLFSMHMLQMSLLFFVLPPLLMVGIPGWLWTAIFSNKRMYALLRIFTKPIVAAVVFNALLSFYHVPFILDTASLNHDAMNAFHAFLFCTAFCMWWPIVNPLPGQPEQLAGLKKMAYLFANGILITPACALIIFAGEPIYQHYMNAPQLFEGYTAFVDQRTGGIIMKLVQEMVYGSVLAYIFYKWRKDEKQDDLPMDQQPAAQNIGVLKPATDQGRA